MDLEKQISDFLSRVETKPPRSKLAPYDALIRTLRRRRWTSQEIADALASEFGLRVNPKTIWAYLHSRRHAEEAYEAPKPTLPAQPQTSPAKRRFNLDA